MAVVQGCGPPVTTCGAMAVVEVCGDGVRPSGWASWRSSSPSTPWTRLAEPAGIRGAAVFA